MFLNSYYVFPVLKQNLRSHLFKDDCEVDTIVRRWLVTQDRQQMKSLRHNRVNVSVVVGTMWKSSGTAVQLNMICYD
jgi:hypothetical protein